MFTRRDALFALGAVGSMFNLRAFARSGPEVMQSSVFDWNSIMPQPTKIGYTKVLSGPDRHTRRARMPRDHVESGRDAAPAAQASRRRDRDRQRGDR